MPPRPDLSALLYAALAEPFGLLLRTNDRERAKAALYAARAQAQNPALAGLQIRTSPFPDGDLVLVNGPARSTAAAKTLKELGL